MSQIHVVDPDVARRNQVARCILRTKYHAEIYEDLEELLAHSPGRGLILAAQVLGENVREALSDGTCAMPVVLYGSLPEPSEIAVSMKAGVLDFLVWPFKNPEFLSALDNLISDGEERAGVLAQIQQAKRSVATLSLREAEVLRMLTQGNSNKETAEELGISSRTVEIHRGNAMHKIGARSSAQAVRIAICAGLDESLKVTW